MVYSWFKELKNNEISELYSNNNKKLFNILFYKENNNDIFLDYIWINLY